MEEKSIFTEDSSAPKNFLLRCYKCRWARTSSGLTADLSDLIEITPGCRNCGKFRRYQCPRCGGSCLLKRIKGNG
jgi:hypothetical protein